MSGGEDGIGERLLTSRAERRDVVEAEQASNGAVSHDRRCAHPPSRRHLQPHVLVHHEGLAHNDGKRCGVTALLARFLHHTHSWTNHTSSRLLAQAAPVTPAIHLRTTATRGSERASAPSIDPRTHTHHPGHRARFQGRRRPLV